MTSPGSDDPSRPIDVAIVRNWDLEARELFLFDRLRLLGLIDARALGQRPLTPYGIAGIEMPIQLLPCAAQYLARLPGGTAAWHRIERRFGVDLSTCWHLDDALGDGSTILNCRETFATTTEQCCDHAETHPDARVVVSVCETIPFLYDADARLRGRKASTLARADRFIANSPLARDALVQEGAPPERIDLIPLATDVDRFTPGPPSTALRQQWGADPDDQVILFTGRLLPEKGLVELVRDVAPLLGPVTTRHTDGTTHRAHRLLVFQGSGPELGRIKRAAIACGVAAWVRFGPWVESRQMPDVYRSADVVVLPSLPTPYWEEQFGYNLAEALACGRPIVATATGAIPWVLGNAGVTVEPYRRGELRAAVAQLLDDPARCRALGELARAEALSRFSVQSAGIAHVEAFQHALAEPPRATRR